MKKIIFSLSVFVLLAVSTIVFAQSTNLTDYGLTEESIKYLSEAEKQEILNSRTPAQTQSYIEQQIKEKGIEEVQKEFPFFVQNTNNTSPEDTSSNPEIVSCFDYYTFGSIEANIQSNGTSAVSGMTMDFFGDIKNKNNYPVVEGTLYVKIMKNIGNEKNPNGPDVVDQFIAMDNITLPSNGSAALAFKWNVPAHAVSGDYRVVTYFISGKKFNLQGLSFTDDIVGGSFDFKVSGEKTGIQFDKSSVSINNNPYYFAAYPPRIQQGEKADIKLQVINDTSEDQSAQIKWSLYKWDAMNPNNLVRTFNTTTELQTNSKGEVSLSIPEESEPVYLLVGELTHKDTKSVVNIRYVRDGVDKVRLNYPAVTSYPLKEGEPTTLFTCLHNSGQSQQVSNNKVTLEVKDEKGRVIESYTYEGTVTGDMMAVKKDFTPKTTLDKFSVHASIYTDGKLVDESVMEYDCTLIDPASCIGKQSFSFIQFVLAVITIVLLVLVLIFIKRKTKGVEVVVLLFVLFGSLLVFDIGIPNSSAQTPLPANLVNPKVTSGSRQVVWNSTLLESLAYHWSNNSNVSSVKCLVAACNNPTGGWVPGLKNPNITVKYNSKIINIDTGQEIQNGANIPLDTKLKLQFIAHHPYDIYWFGTGYSIDSPYGEWRNNSDTVPPIDTCQEKDYLTFINLSAEKISGIYVPLLIDSPNKNLKNSNLTCTDLLEDSEGNYQATCEILAPGPVSTDFIFKATTGNFYYRYKMGNSCIGNNLALRKNLSGKNEWYHTVVSSSPYVLNIPTQTISYTLNAVVPLPSNQPPNPPTITGPTVSTPSTSETFNFVATDADGDQIKYEIDWDNDGISNQTLPSTGVVNSGVSQSTTKSWTSFPQTFKARTVDQYFATSTWATHTVCSTGQTLENGVCTTPQAPLSLTCQSPTNVTIPKNSSSAGPGSVSALASGGKGSYSYSWEGNGTSGSGSTASFSSIATNTNTGNSTSWVIPIVFTVTDSDTPASSKSISCPIQVTDENIISTSQGSGNSAGTITTNFYFMPDIANPALCPIYITVSNVEQCEVRNRLNKVSVPWTSLLLSQYFTNNTLIVTDGKVGAPVGTHSLWCTKVGETNLTQQGFSKSCFSRSEFQEN